MRDADVPRSRPSPNLRTAAGELPQSRRWWLMLTVAGMWLVSAAVPTMLPGLTLLWGALAVQLAAWEFGWLTAGVVGLVVAVAELLLQGAGAGAPVSLATLVSLTAGLGVLVGTTSLYRRHWAREQRLARCDYLTGIANRQALEEALSAEFGRFSRHGRTCTVVLMDCDGFKELNDRHGHARGDAALVRLAQTLRQNVRNYDTVARLGGDEFVVVLAEADLLEAEEVLERLLTQLRFTVEREFHGLTVTSGVVVFRQPPPDVDTALNRADAAMYRARHSGRGRIEFEVYESASPTAPATPTA